MPKKTQRRDKIIKDEKIMRFVLFSGGYDSTYTLLQEAKNSSTNEPIHTLTVLHKNLCSKQYEQEKKARKNIVEELQRRGYNIIEDVIAISSSLDTYSNGWCQSYWWTIYALDYLKNKDTLIFSYVLGDEFYALQNEFKKLQEVIANVYRKDVLFEYPLQYVRKVELYEELRKENLLGLVWTCDSPMKRGEKYIRCGKCPKCIEEKVLKYEHSIVYKK